MSFTFSNLFSKLSAMQEDVRLPDRSGFTFRNQTENPGGTRGRKRKPQGEQQGSYFQKRCSRSQNSSASAAFRDGASQQIKRHQKHGDSPSAGAEETRTSHKSKPCYNNRQSRGGRSFKPNWKKTNQRNKTESNERQYRNRRNENRYERREETQQDEPRFMTQDFKDQNGLLVDGQLVCRHFLYRRCLKEDSCQLLHIQRYNGLIKEPCKFYIQGYCQNGDGCIFMHKSFPCKFFHRRGICLNEENCRFSHDPLDDVTEKLLSEHEKSYETMRQDKAEEETETKKDPDFLTEVLRPSFYSSIDAEKEPNPHETEEGPAPDRAEPLSCPSEHQNHQEPVCYSVEAVLGPQLSRTFASFSKAPGSQEPDGAVSFSNQSEVPYSVDAVLRSFKSASAPVLYNPRMDSDTAGGPQNKNKDKENSSEENMFKSFLSSGRSEGPERTGQEDELESANSRTEGNTHLLTGTPCFPQRPSDFTFSSKPSPPPSDVGELEERAAASVKPVAANVGVHRFAAKQLVDILHNSKTKRPIVKPAASQIAPKRWSRAVESETQKRPAGSEGLVKPEHSAGGTGKSSSFLGLFATPLRGSDPSFRPRDSLAATRLSVKKPRPDPRPTASGLESTSSGLRTGPPVTSQSLRNATVKQEVTPASDQSVSSDKRPPDISSDGFISSDNRPTKVLSNRSVSSNERPTKVLSNRSVSSNERPPEVSSDRSISCSEWCPPQVSFNRSVSSDERRPLLVSSNRSVSNERRPPEVSSNQFVFSDDRPPKVSSDGSVSDDEHPPEVSSDRSASSSECPLEVLSNQSVSSNERPAEVSSDRFVSSDERPPEVLSVSSSDERPAEVLSNQSVSSNERPPEVSFDRFVSSDERPPEVLSDQSVSSSDERPPEVSSDRSVSSDERPPEVSSDRSVSSDERRPPEVSFYGFVSSSKQSLPEVSPPVETSSNSVLKTLFLRLKPYQEDGEPQDFIRSGDVKEKRSTEAPGRSKFTCPGPTPRRQLGDDASKDGAKLNRNTVTPLGDLFKTLDASVFHKL